MKVTFFLTSYNVNTSSYGLTIDSIVILAIPLAFTILISAMTCLQFTIAAISGVFS